MTGDFVRDDFSTRLGQDVPTDWIGGLPIANIDRRQSAELMVDVAMARRGRALPPLIVTSANGQVISMCAASREMRDLFLASDLIHADGMPLVFASRLLCAKPLPERVATTDLIHDTAGVAQARGARFYLLGATRAVIAESTRRLRQTYPNLEIVGYRDGYLKPEDEAGAIEAINRAAPDILWLGMGVPHEQRFALRNRAKLTNVGLIKTSGGLFDFLSGKNSRAPQWMQAAGLEWAYRIMLEPRRLALRYMLTNPHAAYLLLTRTRRSMLPE